MTDELTSEDYAVLASALIKCHLLWGYVKAGVQMVPLTTKNFGFIDLTEEEVEVLMQKLYEKEAIQWLREQRRGKKK